MSTTSRQHQELHQIDAVAFEVGAVVVSLVGGKLVVSFEVVFVVLLLK